MQRERMLGRTMREKIANEGGEDLVVNGRRESKKRLGDVLTTVGNRKK